MIDTKTSPRISPSEANAISDRLKALANPVRMQIVDLIRSRGGDLCVCEIEAHFDLAQPTISHHMKVLREAGFLESRRKGPMIFHQVREDAFGDLCERLGTWGP